MRDKTIDGFRAVAALGVVFAHAVSYRFVSVSVPGWKYAQALAEPFALTSVQIFFVISGYIITSLLLTEERKRGRVSTAAFYIRRVCRIIPPLAAMVLVVAALRWVGYIDLDNASLARSLTFTCNIGECNWWVAHTWSLSVEEQFYLCWPLLLMLVPRRGLAMAIAVVALLAGFLIAPFAFHSNYISFSCIGIGAIYASSERMRSLLKPNLAAWLTAAVILVLGPLLIHAKVMQAAMPFLILYLIFAGREIRAVVWILGLKPVQLIGLVSYSLYLWQQVFLANPVLYNGAPPPVWLLPIIVALSVLLIEQPFILVGRKWSSAMYRSTTAPTVNAAPS